MTSGIRFAYGDAFSDGYDRGVERQRQAREAALAQEANELQLDEAARGRAQRDIENETLVRTIRDQNRQPPPVPQEKSRINISMPAQDGEPSFAGRQQGAPSSGLRQARIDAKLASGQGVAAAEMIEQQEAAKAAKQEEAFNRAVDLASDGNPDMALAYLQQLGMRVPPAMRHAFANKQFLVSAQRLRENLDYQLPGDQNARKRSIQYINGLRGILSQMARGEDAPLPVSYGGSHQNNQPIPDSVLPDAPKEERWTTISDPTIHGLPAGTVAQRGPNGEVKIVSEPQKNEVWSDIEDPTSVGLPEGAVAQRGPNGDIKVIHNPKGKNGGTPTAQQRNYPLIKQLLPNASDEEIADILFKSQTVDASQARLKALDIISSQKDGLGEPLYKTFHEQQRAADEIVSYITGQSAEQSQPVFDQDRWDQAMLRARAEAEGQAGWLSTDGSDFSQDGGNREVFINRRTQEIYNQMTGGQERQAPQAPQDQGMSGDGTTEAPFQATEQSHIDWFRENAQPGQVIVIDGQAYTK